MVTLNLDTGIVIGATTLVFVDERYLVEHVDTIGQRAQLARNLKGQGLALEGGRRSVLIHIVLIDIERLLQLGTIAVGRSHHRMAG